MLSQVPCQDNDIRQAVNNQGHTQTRQPPLPLHQWVVVRVSQQAVLFPQGPIICRTVVICYFSFGGCLSGDLWPCLYNQKEWSQIGSLLGKSGELAGTEYYELSRYQCFTESVKWASRCNVSFVGLWWASIRCHHQRCPSRTCHWHTRNKQAVRSLRTN